MRTGNHIIELLSTCDMANGLIGRTYALIGTFGITNKNTTDEITIPTILTIRNGIFNLIFDCIFCKDYKIKYYTVRFTNFTLIIVEKTINIAPSIIRFHGVVFVSSMSPVFGNPGTIGLVVVVTIGVVTHVNSETPELISIEPVIIEPVIIEPVVIAPVRGAVPHR